VIVAINNVSHALNDILGSIIFSFLWQTTWILHDDLTWHVFTASQIVPGAARGGAQKQASRLRAVHDLCCGAAEHARSHGTAASAACKICCAMVAG